MRVLITNKNTGQVDYTRYVVDGSLTIEDSVNVPTLITFQLANTDSIFVSPKRSSYVTIVSDVYAGGSLFGGSGHGTGKVIATGFITTEPERTYLGLSNRAGKNTNNEMYTYNVQVTSDEWLLNSNTVPYIPAFVNQTDSQILAAIAQALMPNFFNTTAMASGTLVPYFQYDPSQTWSDIAKTFADANRYHYKVMNQTILYQPFGDASLGISYDDQHQAEGYLAPSSLTTGLVTVPPVNDCIVIGDVEPQTNWTNYFIGDGFTSNFQLKHQVFQGTSANLLEDDWTESSFTQGSWTVNDPDGIFVLADGNGNALGALNVVQKGQVGVYQPPQNAEYIQAQNGLELGGGLNLQHGSVTFNDTASGGGGMIGALFGSSVFIPGNALCAFGITGQANLGDYTAVSVQITQGNSQQVVLTFNGTAPPSIQAGNVFACAGYVGAGFLNGTNQSVVSISQISPSQFQIVAQGFFTYNNPYGPAPDSGTANFASNLVMVTASGAAGIVIQPIYNGKYVGPQVVTQVNHQYLLQTWIGAGAPTRYTRPYTNLTQTATYGNQNLASQGTISWVVTDVFLGNYVVEEQNPLFGLFPSAPPPTVTKFTEFNVTLPPFALYCLVNAIDLNVSINYTLLSLPPQGYLTVQSLTGMSGGNLPWLPSQLSVPIVYQLGFGQDNQTAQVSAQGEAYALAFYTDDIPSVGARIIFQSWAAGQSVARVRDPIAIANEAAISGDSGVRSAIMQNLSPLPRTSDECEAAAAAAILDREYPQFQGTYTVDTIPYKFEHLTAPGTNGYPITGRFLYINSPVRGITGQNFAVNTVRIQVLELRQEVLTVAVDYGPDLYLEKLLPAFLEREQNLLVPTQTVAPPAPITLGQVLNAYLPTLDNAQITTISDSLSGNYITVNLGAPPVTGCEVRSLDSGWGIADQGRVGLFTSQIFTLPRTARDQTWYLRTLNGAQYSRFSKALRVVYPLVPAAPTLTSENSQTIVFDYAGDVRDIYGLEVRAPGVTGIVAQTGGTTVLVDNISAFERFALPNNQIVGNAMAVYNPPANPGYIPASGDIILLTCPADASFQGVRLINGTESLSFTGETLSPVGFSGTANVGLGSSGYGIGMGGSGNYYVNEYWYGFPVGVNIPPVSLSVTLTYAVLPSGTANIQLQYSTDNGNTWTNLLNKSLNPTTAPLQGGGTYTANLPANQNPALVVVNLSVQWTGVNLVKLGGGPPGQVSVTVSQPTITEGNTQNYQVMSWYDYGYTVETIGYPGYPYGEVGQVSVVEQGAATSFTVSGSLTTAGVATIYTQAPHGYVPGNYVIVSCGYGVLPATGYNYLSTDGAVYCGVWVVTAVPSPTSFQFNINTVLSSQGNGANNAQLRGHINIFGFASLPLLPLIGLCAQVPIVSSNSIVGNGGVILQRPIFAPSDLVVDLTQPDIAEILELLQATQQNGRITGLVGYFFNLQWDYSAGTVVPTFLAPALTGILIDSATQQISWNVLQGQPNGYRVVVTNQNTGQIQNKFTLNHPNNPQLVTQFQMSQYDFQNPVYIAVTPFDAVGDGVTSIVQWAGGGPPGSTLSSYPVAGQVGDILRYDVNNDNQWDAVNYAQATSMILSTAWGGPPQVFGPMSPGFTILTTQSSINPTATMGGGNKYTSSASASVDTVIGMRSGNNGNNSTAGMLAFYRWTHVFGLNTITNTRCWMGLSCWNNGSTLGNNSVQITGTTAYASDTPNKTTLGFRFSAGTDSHWQAVACVATNTGGLQTTVDTGITPDLNIHTFEMVPNATGTAIMFLIDGVIVATIITNLPNPGASNPADALGELFWVCDNKNTPNAVSASFYSMTISHK